LRVTLDDEADAAYIYTVGDIADGGVARTVTLDYQAAMINVDFDSEGRIVGVEVLGANNTLPVDLLGHLRQSQAPGKPESDRPPTSVQAAGSGHRGSYGAGQLH